MFKIEATPFGTRVNTYEVHEVQYFYIVVPNRFHLFEIRTVFKRISKPTTSIELKNKINLFKYCNNHNNMFRTQLSQKAFIDSKRQTSQRRCVDKVE